MKKLAKLTAVFAGICFVLAISACSHSGSSSGSDPDPVEVLSLTDGEGTFTFFSDMSFYYEKGEGDDYCLKGTYTGDASKDGTLTLTVTEEYDEGAWYKAEEEGGFIFEVSGNSATCREWLMEDGKQVVDDEATTFTKGSSYEPSLKDYYGTWGISWTDGSTKYYEYIVIAEDNTFYYVKTTGEITEVITLTSSSESSVLPGQSDGPNKGTWEYNTENNTMALTKESWFNFTDWNINSEGDWSTNGMDNGKWGYSMTITSETSAQVIGTTDGKENEGENPSTYNKVSDKCYITE